MWLDFLVSLLLWGGKLIYFGFLYKNKDTEGRRRGLWDTLIFLKFFTISLSNQSVKIMIYKLTIKVFSIGGKLPRCCCCEVIRSRDASEQTARGNVGWCWESSDRLLMSISSSILIMREPHHCKVLCALDENNIWELCASYHTCIPLHFQSQISGSGFAWQLQREHW